MAVALFDRRGLDVHATWILVGRREDVALVVQPPVRLEGRCVAEVEQHLVPEARVQQVQHRVLDAAHIEVDTAGIAGALRSHPVTLDVRVDELVLVGGIEVAQLVPARARPLRHRVRLAPVDAGRRRGRARLRPSRVRRQRRLGHRCLVVGVERAARSHRAREAAPAARTRARAIGRPSRRTGSGTARPSTAGG